jgi:hypothetical protein
VPTPITAIVTAAVLAAGGVGVGNALLGSGGTSKAAASRVPALAADPTGRPAHDRFTYPGPKTQAALPSLNAAQGQAPTGGAPGAASGYTPKGQPRAPLSSVPTSAATVPATTWPLYLSGGDLLQPDRGTAVGTNQMIGPSLGGACGLGLAGRWTAPVTATFPFHGPIPGLLHVVASGPTTLTISFTTSTVGGACTVRSSITVTASGSQAVSFTLPRIDVDATEGSNVNLVVEASGSAHITSSTSAPSFIVVPTAPQ